MSAQVIYKKCPKCNSEHFKPGTFCSRKCANSRAWSAEDKLKKSNSAKSSIKVLNANSLKKKPKLTKVKTTKTKPSFKLVCTVCGCNVITTINKPRTCRSKECIQKQKQQAGKASSSKRCKRSKLETKFYELCMKRFTVSHNKPIVNGWDADVVLEDYKIAILWNGPWHYKEMGMTNHSLKQVVNRDIIKIIEFEKLGWDVIIYEDNKWTPEEAFIDIILKVGRR